jgi:toxin ParE1/3/4
MRIELSEYVEGDIQEIADYIAQDSLKHASRLVERFFAAMERIGRNPFHYQLRPNIAEDARLAAVGRYALLFRVKGNVVWIERVVFGGRDLTSLIE